MQWFAPTSILVYVFRIITTLYRIYNIAYPRETHYVRISLPACPLPAK